MTQPAAPTNPYQRTTIAARSSLSTPMNISLIAVFAAIVAASTLAPAIPTGLLGVPITLQTLAIMLAALILGGARGSLAVLLYVVVGLLGLPVFAKFNSGFGVLAGPSAGYLLAFPIAALAAGALATYLLRRYKLSFWRLFLAAMTASIVIIHPLGIIGMMVNGGIDLGAAFMADVVFWPGDVIKNLIAAGISLAVLKAYPDLVVRKF